MLVWLHPDCVLQTLDWSLSRRVLANLLFRMLRMLPSILRESKS